LQQAFEQNDAHQHLFIQTALALMGTAEDGYRDPRLRLLQAIEVPIPPTASLLASSSIVDT